MTHSKPNYVKDIIVLKWIDKKSEKQIYITGFIVESEDVKSENGYFETIKRAVQKAEQLYPNDNENFSLFVCVNKTHQSRYIRHSDKKKWFEQTADELCVSFDNIWVNGRYTPEWRLS